MAWALVGSLAVLVAAPAWAASPPKRLVDAAQSGAFNVGAARATAGPASDPAVGHGFLKLDYSLPRGTAAGIWAKGFSLLDADHHDAVSLAARATDPDAARNVAATLEIKGTAGIQKIPLGLGPDWTQAQHPLDWKAIGSLNEVVVSVGRVGDAEVASGSISFDVTFDNLPWIRKVGESPVARVGLVSAVAGLLGLLATLAWAASGRRPGHGKARPPGPARDLVQGVGTVLIVGLALTIFDIGGRGGADALRAAMVATVAGAAVAAWWKVGLVGEVPTAGEVFRDALATGLLAASSSPMGILQAPGGWPDALQLSQFVAMVAAFAYHLAVANRLAMTGKHPGAVASALIVGTPYAVGSLVLLSSAGLMNGLGDRLTSGSLADRPELLGALGRVLVLFGFNEAVALGLGLATKGRGLRSIRAHLAFLAVAVAAVVAPSIADYGSGPAMAGLNAWGRMLGAVAAAALSQAGLWAEVYLITGLLLDALRGSAPSEESAVGHPVLGMKKGMVYSGTFMGLLYGLGALWTIRPVPDLAEGYPAVAGLLFGAVAFPMVKTIFETFDGSQAFFRRVARSYANPLLYARGAAVGLGLGLGLSHAVAGESMATRSWFGAGVGVAAFAGINFLADLFASTRGRGRVRSGRVYAVQAILGGFIGAAIGFYLDSTQVGVVAAKFGRYLAVDAAPTPFIERALLSNWGLINLGTVSGGVKLLFAESLLGVISWAVPAWLFAINRTFMAAYFQKESAPIRALFTRDGLAQLSQNMIEVLRWGLWMSPIINSFLRPMGDPTWYNQDGAIRTGLAIARDATMSPDAFRAWSLQVFISLVAYDGVRVLIWLDHMGLRVATLVNLSFLGMDRLDNRLSRFIAPAATARCIPEGVKRFTTWAPLLIPYYIPRGADWDVAWGRAQALRGEAGPGTMAALMALPWAEKLPILAGAAAAASALYAAVRSIRSRAGARSPRAWSLANTEYEVTVAATGEVVSRDKARGFDVSRRSYDFLDPAGRALFLVDGSGSWPLIGNFPGGFPEVERVDDSLRVAAERDGLRASVTIRLAGPGDPAEVWEVAVENPSDSPRRVMVVPYLEWVLNRPDADRGHTQYNRLFAEMEYAAGLHAVLAWDKHGRAMGILASDATPEGFLTSRVDFIGRARNLSDPRALETLAFSAHQDTDAHPTFDPIGSLLLGLDVPARGSARARILIGMVADKSAAIGLISRALAIPGALEVAPARRRKEYHPIGHGEVPPGTPLPYHDFSEDGRTMTVRTPFTPRPFDHTMSNALGHVVAVTNRGLHTSSSVNAQQNRLTPDWPDTVTREVPGEAFYLHDPATGEWFSPTYHPTNDAEAAHEAGFGVDGTATFHMKKGPIETELTVFVPPDDPAGVYLLTVRNASDRPRRLRVAPYFQMVLAGQPEHAGPLQVRADAGLHALFFENPRNTYRTGPAFAAISEAPERTEIVRGRFFGPGRDVARPALVERGTSDPAPTPDDRPVAAFLATLEVPARGERSLVVVMGQAADRATAEAVIRKYRDVAGALAGLEETRRWWTSLMDTVRVETASPEFDGYLDWLKYQALAERIWARRGFYQASGAFGFRDQLQDSINLLWMDPAVARRQVILHASQQFLEGDVVHWFHRLQDGRTGFAARTHASDNLLWLAWGVVEYVGATGDDSLLDERTPYLESEIPFPPLPEGKHGMGFDPLRSSREDTVYRHALRSIDLVLGRRMGAHGLPLIGTGDWNDGLDEIGSQGRGESVWLGFFLHYILERMAPIVARKDGRERADHYLARMKDLGAALERTWRDDRYLRAIHDDGTEIGLKDSGVWEIDALTAAWAVMSGIDPDRGRVVFETALRALEKDNTILLGWPPLREDTKPYLGRSSWYPEGVRENGMYCHGVQWLVGAARILADRASARGNLDDARQFRETAYRLWRKISAIPHTAPGEIETYGGQPNQQAADMVTTFDPGRMIWNGYTGAAGWMFRQALEGVLGVRLVAGAVVGPAGIEAAADLGSPRVDRDVSASPLPPDPGGRHAPPSPVDSGRPTIAT